MVSTKGKSMRYLKPEFVLIVFSVLCMTSCRNAEESQPSEPSTKARKTEQKTLGPSDENGNDTDASARQTTGPSGFEDKLVKYEKAYLDDADDADALIWYGRFLAYDGQYEKAISIYTTGISRFPSDARMLRHRGHRYITLRKFDLAIEDLEVASKLIAGKENQIEPDGMPNPRNIPVSTLHGNIWYHLGLAYYLKQDFPNALRSYQNCLRTASRPDNVVSATHWIYMIHRRMGNVDAANECLKPVVEEMDVIENTSYHRCCLFYQGALTLEQIGSDLSDGSADDAIRYAIGNWHYYSGEIQKAREQFESMTKGKSGNSFGFIAAETDLKLIE